MGRHRVSVVTGLSGGVDSFYAAYLLKNEGYEVIGVSILMMENENFEDVEMLASKLGIEHMVVDRRKEFEKYVVEQFIEGFGRGRTPNPCAICNRYVKFPALCEVAGNKGASHIATGHYAIKTDYHGHSLVMEGGQKLKDQSYMLALVEKKAIDMLLLPIGARSKEEVKANVATIKADVRQESKNICFIKGDHRDFLRKRIPYGFMKGPVVDLEGKIVGEHEGFASVTVGQRRNIKTNLNWKPSVLAVDVSGNRVIVGPEHFLLAGEFEVENVVWHVEPSKITELRVRIRNHHPSVSCKIERKAGETSSEEQLRVKSSIPLRAVTPGQVAAFYDGKVLVGGGIISGVKAKFDFPDRLPADCRTCKSF